MPANTGVFLNEHDLITAIGDIKGGLDTGDTSPYDEGSFVDSNLSG